MILVTGIPTGMFYDYFSSDKEAEEYFINTVDMFKEAKNDIRYQTVPLEAKTPKSFKFQYCLSDFFRQYRPKSESAVYYVIFAKQIFEHIVEDFVKKMNNNISVNIVNKVPVWVVCEKTPYGDENFSLSYEEPENYDSEIGLYFIKIKPSEKYNDAGLFVAYYLTLVYLRLFCLGEPFFHYGVEYNILKHGEIMDYIIKLSNEKTISRDRLIDIHSLTRKYPTNSTEFKKLGDIEYINKVFPSLEKVITEFKGYGDCRQTFMVKNIHEGIKSKVSAPHTLLQFKVGDIVKVKPEYQNIYYVTGKDMIKAVIQVVREHSVTVKIIEHKLQRHVDEVYEIEKQHLMFVEDNFNIYDYVVPKQRYYSGYLDGFVFGKILKVNEKTLLIESIQHTKPEYENRIFRASKEKLAIVPNKDEIDVLKRPEIKNPPVNMRIIGVFSLIYNTHKVYMGKILRRYDNVYGNQKLADIKVYRSIEPRMEGRIIYRINLKYFRVWIEEEDED